MNATTRTYGTTSARRYNSSARQWPDADELVPDGGHLLDLDESRLEEKGSAWEKWIKKYAVDARERDGRVTLKVGAMLDRLKSTSVPHLEEVLAAWKDLGRDSEEFATAQVSYKDRSGQRKRAIPREVIDV